MLSLKPISDERLKLDLIQGNIGQSQKWSPKYAEFNMRTYADLSLEVSKQQPDLIVWSETTTPKVQKLFTQCTAICWSS